MYGGGGGGGGGGGHLSEMGRKKGLVLKLQRDDLYIKIMVTKAKDLGANPEKSGIGEVVVQSDVH